MGAFFTFMFHGVSPELVIQPKMAPLVEEIEIIIGEQGVLIKHGVVLFFTRLLRHVKLLRNRIIEGDAVLRFHPAPHRRRCQKSDPGRKFIETVRPGFVAYKTI